MENMKEVTVMHITEQVVREIQYLTLINPFLQILGEKYNFLKSISKFANTTQGCKEMGFRQFEFVASVMFYTRFKFFFKFCINCINMDWKPED